MHADLGILLCHSCDNRDSAYDTSYSHRPCRRRRPADRSDVQVQTSHLAHLLLILLSFVSPVHLLLRFKACWQCLRLSVPTCARVDAMVCSLFCMHLWPCIQHSPAAWPHCLSVCLSVGMLLSSLTVYGMKFTGFAMVVPSKSISINTHKDVSPVIHVNLERRRDLSISVCTLQGLVCTRI